MVVETKRGKLPIRYGWNALADFGDESGKTMDEILGMDPSALKISEMISFIYVGFKEGARKKGEQCKIESKIDLGDMIDDDVTIISQAIEAFIEFVKDTETKSEGSKKK